MVKSFRFLMQFVWINLGAVLAFALIVTVGAFLTGVPDGAENLFETYFSSFPFMALIILYLYAFALCTSNLNLALSFGASRRGYFLALQGVLLLYTLVCWLLQGVMSSIPGLFHWTNQVRWSILLSMGGFSFWAYPLLCLAVLGLGCLCGTLFIRSKALGVVVVCISGVLGIAGVVLLFLTADEFVLPGVWSYLPAAFTAAAVAIVGISEGFLWHTISKYTVK